MLDGFEVERPDLVSKSKNAMAQMARIAGRSTDDTVAQMYSRTALRSGQKAAMKEYNSFPYVGPMRGGQPSKKSLDLARRSASRRADLKNIKRQRENPYW